MPLPITHREGTMVEMYHQGNLVARLIVTIIKKYGTRDKGTEFMFRNALNGEKAQEYSIRGEERVKPMENSPPPMNQLEIYVNQNRRTSGGQISLYYDAPSTLKILRRD